MLVGAYRLALDAILQSFAKALLPVLDGMDIRDPESRKHFAPILHDLVVSYRGDAIIQANSFLMSEAERFGAQAYIPESDRYSVKAVEKVLRESQSVDVVADSLVRHVEAGARRQMQRATPGDEYAPEPPEHHGEARSGSNVIYPVAWARVLTGADNCSFCVMLASRGAVYSSKAHAGSKSYKFHNNCDCLVVPVFDREDWPGKEAADYLYKIWEETGSQKELGNWLKENTLSVPNMRSAVSGSA